VISGFTSAAALVIGFSQLKHLLGFDIPRSHLITDTIKHALIQLEKLNPATLAIAIGSLALLILWKGPLPRWLRKENLPESLIQPVSKIGL